MRSFSALKDAVKGSVEKLQQARNRYYAGDQGFNEPLSNELGVQQAHAVPEEPDPVLEHLLSKARSPEVRAQFLLIPPENYTIRHNIKILAATYNVNGRAPPEDVDLSPWLGPGRYADIVAVGFQETVPLNATNIVLGATVEAAQSWDAQVSSTLNSSGCGGSKGVGSSSSSSSSAQKAAEGGRANAPGAADGSGGAVREGAAVSFSLASRPSSAFIEKGPPAPLAAAAAELGAQSGAPKIANAASLGGYGGQGAQQAEQALGGDPAEGDLLGMLSMPLPAGTAGEGGAGAAGEGGGVEGAEGMLQNLGLGDPPPKQAGAAAAAAATAAAGVDAAGGAEEGGASAGARLNESGSSSSHSMDSMGSVENEESATGASLNAGGEEGGEQGGREGAGGLASPGGKVGASQGAAPGNPDEFVQVAGKQMVGVYLSVWARRSLLPHIRGVQVTSVATGALGYFGNKGAVAVRMRVYDSGFCFVNAHLSSGEAEGDELRRNYDYAEVMRRGYFPPEDSPQAAADAQGISKVLHPGRHSGHWGGAYHILDCDHAIWMGDLNYRLQGIAAPDVLAAIQAGELEFLLARDQLQLMMRSRQAFHGWQERAITFPPTFKLKRGTAQYLGEDREGSSSSRAPSSADLAGLQDVISDEQSSMTLTASQAAFEAGSSSNGSGQGSGNGGGAGKQPQEKARAPAWTDRILWRSSQPGHTMQQLTYAAAEGVTVSDHRPVAGAFSAPAKEYVRDQVEAALEVARRVADAREMAAIPHCSAQPTSFELGSLEYGQACEHSLTLTNTAQAPANFKFVPVPGSTAALPRWLAAHPTQGCVPVGGSIAISLRACIVGGPGGAAEAVLSEQRCSLDSILVLRVEGGNDIFLSLQGRYVPSCFGLSLSTLASMPRPIASPVQQQPSGGLQVEGETFFDPLHTTGPGVPPELIRLTDLLRHSAWLATPGLFVKASDLATAYGAVARRLSSRGSSGLGGWEGRSPRGGDGAGAGGHFVARAGSQGEGREGGPGGGGLGPLAAAAAAAAAASSPRQALWQAAAPPPLQLPRLGSGGGAGEGPTSPAAQRRHDILQAMRRALDSGGPFPADCDAHDAAAALLAFFAALPQPLLPREVAEVCDVCVPAANTAASVIVESVSPTELAVLCHMLLLMVEVLAPENRQLNGLSPASLAAILAEIWFQPLPHAATPTASQALAARSVAGAASVAEISMRRIELVQLLLEDGSVLQALCAAL